MYRTPSRKRRPKEIKKPNLIPILDAVFIFIFFLLMSSSFINIFEISSDIPIVSSAPPPEDAPDPLALTLQIDAGQLTLSSGVPSRQVATFGKTSDGSYDLEGLRETLYEIKMENPEERTIVLMPIVDLEYREIVRIMDAVRVLRRTDEAIFMTNEDGIDVRVNELFGNVVFGNIRS